MTSRRVTGVRWVLAALLASGALATTSAGRATTPPDTAPGLADAATTPDSHASADPPPASPGVTATSTPAPLVSANGLFTSPDGTFVAAFDATPSEVVDAENGVASYLHGVEEDTQTVAVFTSGAFGVGPGGLPTERTDRFLEASGSDIERLVNTPTRLGPFLAGHFIARLTLGDGRRAAVYGLVVDRLATAGDVVYAFYTDIGIDDNAAALAFVGSFELRFAALPAPPSTTTTTPLAPTTTSGLVTSVAAVTTPLDATTGAAPAATGTTATTTPRPAVPDGATESYDGRWWVTFPEGAAPELRAGNAGGFGYAEYFAKDGDDTLSVLVTDVPIGFQWIADDVVAGAAERAGGEVPESATLVVGRFDAVRFTVALEENDSVHVLEVNAVAQVYTVSFVDGGAPSPDVVADFLASFTIAP